MSIPSRRSARLSGLAPRLEQPLPPVVDDFQPDSQSDDSSSNYSDDSEHNSNEFEAEEILAERTENGQTFFLIKWKDFSPEDNSWEPYENIKHLTTLINLRLFKLQQEYCTQFFPEHILTQPRKKFSAKKRQLVWTTYHGDNEFAECPCCAELIHRNEDGFHVGHIIAHNKGGSDDIDNLRPVCRTCNLAMQTQDMRQFARNIYNRNIL